ncbi:hypothetical protein VSP10_06525 [Myroides odoratimimus]|nr:hypothetical protein [Myroides odoratimimus]
MIVIGNMLEKYRYVLAFVLCVLLGQLSPLYAQFTIQESFTHQTVNSKVVLGDHAILTASQGLDRSGEGWLRLTSDGMNQKGYAIIEESFPSDRGVLIDFEYKSWRRRDGNTKGGADGISVFLYDGSIPKGKFRLGSYGGSLGYGPGNGVSGVTGGYIAVGLDEYGNFTQEAVGRPSMNGSFAQSVVLRGKVVRDLTKTARYLTHVRKPGDKNIDNSEFIYSRPDDYNFYRRVQIEMKPILEEDRSKKKPDGSYALKKKFHIKVRLQSEHKGGFVEVLDYKYDELPYETLKIGFAASTGAAVNIHEIKDLNVTTPEGLMINKSVNLLEAKKGDKLSYTLEMSNHSSDLYKDFKLNDYLSTIKEFFRVDEIFFDNRGNYKNTLTPPSNIPSIYSAKSIENWKVNLDAHSSSRVIINGTVIGYPGLGVLSNEAYLDISSLKLPYVDPTKIRSIAHTNIVGKPHPKPSISSDVSVICEGDEAILTAKKPLTTIGTVESYRWFKDGNLFKVREVGDDLEDRIIEELLPIESIRVTESGEYSVVYVIKGVSSEESAKVKINVNPIPKLKLKNNSDALSYTLNVGDSFVLPILITDNARDIITWYDTNGEEIIDRTSPKVFNQAGVYNYTVVAESANGCSDIKNIQVNVFNNEDCPPTYERYWATDYTAWYSALTGGVSNKSNAIDGRPDTYSTITVGLGLLGLGTTWQNIYFKEDQAAGTPVTVKLGKEYSGLVALGGITVVGLDANGKKIGTLQGVDGGLVDLLAADNVLEYTFVPSNKKGPQKYRGVQVVLGSTVGVAQNAKVYGAYVTKQVESPSCAAVLPNINPNVLDVLHGVEDIGLGVASATASVSHPWNAVDDDPNSYAVIARGVAVANMASLTVVFKQTALPGDELHITAENKNPGVLSLELVKGFKIQRYLGDKKVGEPLTESNGALRLRLLGIGGRDRYRIIVAPSTEPFDRVKISYGSVVGVLGDFTHIYNVDLVPRVEVGMEIETDQYGYELEQILQLCEGEPLRIQPQNSHCTSYEVYTSEKGTTRLPALGDMFTIDLSKHYKVGDEFIVYVQAVRNGCTIGSRTPIKIKINSLPSVERVVAKDHKGKQTTVVDQVNIKGGQPLQLSPVVTGEIQRYDWEYLLDTENEWKAFPFATVDNPEVEIRVTILERDKDNKVIFDQNDKPIVKQQGGVFITKPGTGALTITFPKDAKVNGENWHNKKGKVRLTITNLTGCSTSVIYDLTFLRGFREGIFSNPMLPSKKTK